jgi:hypothetical protein
MEVQPAETDDGRLVRGPKEACFTSYGDKKKDKWDKRVRARRPYISFRRVAGLLGFRRLSLLLLLVLKIRLLSVSNP